MRQLLKIIILNAGLVLILVSFALCDQTEQLTITTYYPSPYGSYNELQLYPHATATTCTASIRGTLYYHYNNSNPADPNNNKLKACDGADWVNIGSSAPASPPPAALPAGSWCGLAVLIVGNSEWQDIFMCQGNSLKQQTCPAGYTYNNLYFYNTYFRICVKS